MGWHDQVGKGKVQAIRNNGMVQNSGAISDTTKPNLIQGAGKILFGGFFRKGGRGTPKNRKIFSAEKFCKRGWGVPSFPP